MKRSEPKYNQCNDTLDSMDMMTTMIIIDDTRLHECGAPRAGMCNAVQDGTMINMIIMIKNIDEDNNCFQR